MDGNAHRMFSPADDNTSVLLRVNLSSLDSGGDSQVLSKTLVFPSRAIVSTVIDSIVRKFGVNLPTSSSSSNSKQNGGDGSEPSSHIRSSSAKELPASSSSSSSSGILVNSVRLPSKSVALAASAANNSSIPPPSALRQKTSSHVQAQMPLVKYGLFVHTHSSHAEGDHKHEGAWMESSKAIREYLSFCASPTGGKGGKATVRSMDVSLENAMLYVTVSDYCEELQKKVLVDVSQSVHELIPVIVSRFALPHGYEYSLQVATVRQACEDSDEGQLRRSNGDPTDGNHTHTHTQSSSSPLSTSSSFRWLSETANLSAQGVYLSRDFSAKLILRKKFWLNDSFLRTSNPYELHFAYLEVRQQVFDGTHPVSLEEAIEFASLHTQITYRNYDPLLHTTGFLRLAEILPPQHRGIGFIEEHIYKLHRQLKDMPEEKAKALYLRRAMKYGTFGVSFVQCREHTTSGHSNTGMFIGVDSNSVVILHGDNKDAVSVYNLHEVNQEDFKVTLNKRDLWWRIGDTIRHFTFNSVEEISALVSMFNGYRSRKCHNELGEKQKWEMMDTTTTQSTHSSRIYV